MAMEYVAGADLGAVLARLRDTGGLRMPAGLSPAGVAREVALALDHAHRQVDGAGRNPRDRASRRLAAERAPLLRRAGEAHRLGIARAARRTAEKATSAPCEGR